VTQSDHITLATKWDQVRMLLDRWSDHASSNWLLHWSYSGVDALQRGVLLCMELSVHW
jgi:hypothetical protein